MEDRRRSQSLTVHSVLKLRAIEEALNFLSIAQTAPKPRARYPLRRAYFISREGEGGRGDEDAV